MQASVLRRLRPPLHLSIHLGHQGTARILVAQGVRIGISSPTKVWRRSQWGTVGGDGDEDANRGDEAQQVIEDQH